MEMDTVEARVIINVVNDQDGAAEYAVRENEDGTELRVELVAGDLDINPDGVPTNPAYEWFTTDDGGTTKNAIVGITDTTSATLDIDGYTPPMGEVIGVTVSYQDPLNVADGDMTMVDVLASPIKLSQSSYTGTINEDGTLLADNAGNDIPLPQVMATADGTGHTIFYHFLVDNSLSGTDQGFIINQTTGQISTSNPTLDHETADSITLTVRVTYDSNRQYRRR